MCSPSTSPADVPIWRFPGGRWLAWPLAETARNSLQDVQALKQQLQAAATPRAPLHASGATNKRVQSAQPGKGSKQAPTHTCGKVRGWSKGLLLPRCVHLPAWKAPGCWTSACRVHAEVRLAGNICRRFETCCASASPACSRIQQSRPKEGPCLQRVAAEMQPDVEGTVAPSKLAASSAQLPNKRSKPSSKAVGPGSHSRLPDAHTHVACWHCLLSHRCLCSS